jgi:divalent metal cation (Fe/Co/Zn/Cd) transporter
MSQEVTSENIEDIEKIERDMEPIFEIPSDSQTIWPIQRFFLFSVIFVVVKIWISILANEYISILVIAIDSVLDLSVSGLGIYVIYNHMQKKEQKVKDEDTPKDLNEQSTGVAFLQGLIFLIGGFVVIVMAINTIVLRRGDIYGLVIVPPKFNIFPTLLLAITISAKFWIYQIHKIDAKETDNVAVKSLGTNLLIDILMNLSAWLIMLSNTLTSWFWYNLDPVIAIILGIWMIIEGIKYLKPGFQKLQKAWELENQQAAEKKEEKANN